jgi:PE-PPE domain
MGDVLVRTFLRSLVVTLIALLAAVALAVGSTLTTAVTLTATTALIMGGTGRPNPDDFPGYVPNVAQYYIAPNSVCQSPDCDLVSVYTPETAWPVYGGMEAPTWKQSIIEGTELFGDAVQDQLEVLGPDDNLVLFGYSQSGAILAYQKAALADLTDEEKAQIEFVVIGDVSRPNGGLNTRLLGFSAPIVEFPYGPAMPTDTGIKTTDIAMKWDIIADAPLYVTNPLALINAILGFQYVHGTYPYPTEATPNRTPGGYTVEQWQWMMDNPELYPELVDVQEYGDTEYITVTPTVLPLVAPLHGVGLKPLADLIEPALRVLIEQTGYNRSLPYGQVTGFRLLPLFNPVKLAVDLALAVPQGINQMIAGLRGEPTWIVPAPPETLQATDTDEGAAAVPEVSAAQRVSRADSSAEVDVADVPDPAADTVANEDDVVTEDDDTEAKTPEKPKNPLRAVERGVRDFADQVTKALQPHDSDESDASAGAEKTDTKKDRLETKRPAKDTDADAGSGGDAKSAAAA